VISYTLKYALVRW